MNGIQLNSKPRRNDKPVPGCLGRMVNLFDLTSSISGNRLLTDRPHNDGSSLSRSRSDVSRMSSIAGEEMQDKVMISELRRSSSSKKANGTPVKMLIAQEMSQDLVESRHNSPNVVARLMGLDALPQQQPDLASRRSHSQCYKRNSHTEKPIEYWHEEHGFFNLGQSGHKDIYETWQQSQRTNCIRDKSPQKGRCNENFNEKKLALIRQKFVEAKRLATDEKLRQTKEFQDALDVLSSNGDLFLKVLQEPTSLFPPPLETKRILQQQQHTQWSPTKVGSGQTKRITVLKPSKMLVDDKFVAPAKRNEKQTTLWDNHNGFSPTMSTCPTQPTRIVVLKPSMVKVNDVKEVVSSIPSSPHTLPGEISIEEPEDEEAREAREMAKKITNKMRENLAAGHRRDETLLSSVFSNGYTGDESSFDKSDNEFAAGNLSDTEVMSPTSRHSWDYVNRYGSPFSSSSFSHASCSPESSVCREAKKRLSDRWAMMSSNGSNLEQRHVRISSSTLGEMLALSETKNAEICEEEDNNNDQGNGDDSPRGLLRSKSVPASSTAYGERLNVQVSKETVKTKASKSSFTGKVASLFFSRTKKSRNEKLGKPQSDDLSQLETAETLGTTTSNDHCEVVASPTSRLRSGNIMGDLNDKRLGEGICPQQGGLCASSQPAAPGIQGENQDQPSPISVLEPPFEDESATLASSCIIEPNTYGKQLPLWLSESNLIDKSPPIGSIARTLSWDECGAETTANYHPLSSPFVSPRAKDNEGELLFLVQSLLSMAGLDDEGQLSSNFARWHSPGTPLDPVLRDKYIDSTTKEPLHEAKRRQLRSTRKLVFDCVNTALVDITGMGMTPIQWAGPNILDRGSTGLAGVVWARMKEWFSGEVEELSIDGDDISSSLVEIVVRKEVVGKGWAEQMRIEIDNLGKEIEGKLLEELVEESVVELNGF